MAASDVLGVIIFARHGDRQGFYQDPVTYTPSNTAITPLGEQQEFQLGTLLRSLYLNASSPTLIQDISVDLFNQSQAQVRADAGGEGGVIFASSVALLQGLWPATPLSNITLANGTVVTGPLGGYQYVPIESVEPDQDVSLEGWTQCKTFETHTSQFYGSEPFKQRAKDAAGFLHELQPYLGNRNVTLENMWNIFDFMNVQSIHNATFANELPDTFLEQARELANFHEYGVFTDSTPDGIGNIAFRTMIPSVVTAMRRIANATDPLKLHYSAISYKPFLSFFNMTGLVADGALPPAIVDYAASIVLEVRQSGSSEPVLRLNFKNGTADDAFGVYPMSLPHFPNAERGDVPISAFIDALQPVAVNSTREWCRVCGQATARGCADLVCPARRSVVPRTLGQECEAALPVGVGSWDADRFVVVAGAVLAALALLAFISLRRRAKDGQPGSERQASGSHSSEARSTEKTST